MSITTAQIFQIGSVLITLVGFLLGLFYDAQLVSGISAAVLTAWNAIGAILTKPSDQVTDVVKRIEEPSVKTSVVTAVANLEGVSSIKTNNKADDALRAIASSNAVPKVT